MFYSMQLISSPLSSPLFLTPGTPCNGLSCHNTNRNDGLCDAITDGRHTSNDTANFDIQSASHETTKPLWPCTGSTDSVYVTVLDGRERNVSRKMCSAVNSHIQEKNELQSLKLSSSIKWCSGMMKTNEGSWDTSIRRHQYTTQSQELSWIKTKMYFCPGD